MKVLDGALFWMPFVLLALLAFALASGLKWLVGEQRFRRARPVIRVGGIVLLTGIVTVQFWRARHG